MEIQDDSDKQMREMREHLRRLKHKLDLAEARLSWSETAQCSILRVNSNICKNKFGGSKIFVEGSFGDFLLRSLSIFKESNAQLRTEAKEASDRSHALENRVKELEASIMPLKQVTTILEVEMVVVIRFHTTEHRKAGGRQECAGLREEDDPKRVVCQTGIDRGQREVEERTCTIALISSVVHDVRDI
eukprot:612120-Hanusia_phi.AAC.2